MKFRSLFKRGDGHYQIMIVPANSARMKSFRLRHNTIRRLLLAGVAAAVLLLGVIAILAAKPYYESGDSELLRQNVNLQTELLEVRTKLALLDNTLDRLEKFDRKLRVMTDFVDTRPKVAIGPLSESEMIASQLQGQIHTNEALSLKLKDKLGELESADLSKEIDRLLSIALEREKELAELGNFLEDQKLLLSHTPSIWPTEGWMTSVFGYRQSPFTSAKIFHEGLDIANNIGTPVYAPADGTIIFTGDRGGYGHTLVINHGFGLTTRYAHLSSFKVEIGARVKRGDIVGTLGNTGRSTGPHLHYEVRLNNIPQDPRRYILE
ncbi:MAG: M23 family peptidase [Myxococcales bacterium]|nr:MAG: M23 family peptidase [Myxococcales bacterium]